MEQIQKFEALSGSVNLLRSYELGLKYVAAGLRCRERLCEISGGSRFARAEVAVLARPACFSAGRTSPQCSPHLEAACILLGRSPSRMTEAVMQAAE